MEVHQDFRQPNLRPVVADTHLLSSSGIFLSLAQLMNLDPISVSKESNIKSDFLPHGDQSVDSSSWKVAFPSSGSKPVFSDSGNYLILHGCGNVYIVDAMTGLLWKVLSLSSSPSFSIAFTVNGDRRVRLMDNRVGTSRRLSVNAKLIASFVDRYSNPATW
jgi:hypothetical protein